MPCSELGRIYSILFANGATNSHGIGVAVSVTCVKNKLKSPTYHIQRSDTHIECQATLRTSSRMRQAVNAKPPIA